MTRESRRHDKLGVRELSTDELSVSFGGSGGPSTPGTSLLDSVNCSVQIMRNTIVNPGNNAVASTCVGFAVDLANGPDRQVVEVTSRYIAVDTSVGSEQLGIQGACEIIPVSPEGTSMAAGGGGGWGGGTAAREGDFVEEAECC